MSYREVFGIKVSPAGIRLLNEVERLYGKTLSEKTDDSLAQDTQGYADTATDGTPIITINPLSGRNETNIIHELFHLEMQAKGFPLFDYDASPELLSRNKKYLDQMRVQIYDPMTHHLFFPKMRKMSLNPSEHILAQYSENRRSNSLPSEEFLATYYYRIALEIGDQALLKDMAEWYQEKKWIGALVKGQYLYKIVKQLDPKTPDEMITAFVKCANLLKEGKVVYQFRRIDERKYGRLTKKYAIISVFENN